MKIMIKHHKVPNRSPSPSWCNSTLVKKDVMPGTVDILLKKKRRVKYTLLFFCTRKQEIVLWLVNCTILDCVNHMLFLWISVGNTVCAQFERYKVVWPDNLKVTYLLLMHQATLTTTLIQGLPQFLLMGLQELQFKI